MQTNQQQHIVRHKYNSWQRHMRPPRFLMRYFRVLCSACLICINRGSKQVFSYARELMHVRGMDNNVCTIGGSAQKLSESLHICNS